VQSRKPVVALRRPPPPAAIETFIKSGEAPTDASPGELAVDAQASAPSAETAGGPAAVEEAPTRIPSHDVHPIRPLAAAATAGALVRPGIVRRASGRVRRRTTVYLEPALAKWLVMFSAESEVEISDVVEQALTVYRDAQQRAR
jgi:hypothetical protein